MLKSSLRLSRLYAKVAFMLKSSLCLSRLYAAVVGENFMSGRQLTRKELIYLK